MTCGSSQYRCWDVFSSEASSRREGNRKLLILSSNDQLVLEDIKDNDPSVG